MKYYIVLITTIIILCIIALVIKKCLKKSNTETDISTMMITTGISLIVAAFPGTKEAVISFVAEMVGKTSIHRRKYCDCFHYSRRLLDIKLGSIYLKKTKIIYR